ncbi:hypothetical protein Nepgr_033708 [Nepenthes gracilis]|uniref:Uncharacterized protein n=1 Tax=Nepenthes gracilis TaxID=150966 RepID=A0AAD3TMJ1_NEPGR|nr:hypothetical protein Nepgr_033708 [Nepenthes gracilis]
MQVSSFHQSQASITPSTTSLPASDDASSGDRIVTPQTVGKAGRLGLLNVARFGVLALKSGDAAVRVSFAASSVLEDDAEVTRLPLGVGGSAACEVAELLAFGNFFLNVVVVGITIAIGCNVYVH